jgi:putative DNA primase/helicase
MNPAELNLLRSSTIGWAMNDYSLAVEVSEDFKDRILWNGVMGWMQYANGLWSKIEEVTAYHECGEALKFMFDIRSKAYRQLGEDDKIKEATRLLQDSLHKAVFHKLKGFVTLKGDPWDKDPFILNTPSGMVDLKSPLVVGHRPDFYSTKQTTVPYYEEAWQDDYNPEDDWHQARKDWLSALDCIPYDAHLWIQGRIGQAATGELQPDGEIIIARGGGHNGKTAFFAPIIKALGPYLRVVPKELITGRLDAHPTERMTLKGVRAAFLEELAEGRHLNIPAVKAFADTDIISGRFMNKDFVEFEATHSLFITTNYVVQVSETDDGTWRRLKLLPFPFHYLKPGEVATSPLDIVGDRGIKRRLKENKDSHEVVLSYIVAGAREYYAGRSVEEPESVTKATAEWRGQSDAILSYVEDNLEFDPDAMTTTDDLFKDFTLALGKDERARWSSSTFIARFEDHTRVRAHGVVRRQTRDFSKIVRRPDRGWSDMVEPITSQKPWVWVGFRIKPNAPLPPGVLSVLSVLSESTPPLGEPSKG